MNTQFISKAVNKHKTKALVGGGTGLSVAAVVFLYANFPTKTEVERIRDSQRQIWQRITDNHSEQQKQINDLKIEIEVQKRQTHR